MKQLHITLITLLCSLSIYSCEKSEAMARATLEGYIAKKDGTPFSVYANKDVPGTCITAFEVVMGQFLKNGGKLTAPNKEGKTLLQLAQTSNNECAQKILEAAIKKENE